jgi:hypothetical protein
MLILCNLSLESEILDECYVSVSIFSLEILQMLSACRDHRDESTTRVVVLLVHLEMLSQFLDALGEHRDLYWRRSGIRFVYLVLLDNCLFLSGGKHTTLSGKISFDRSLCNSLGNHIHLDLLAGENKKDIYLSTCRY